MATPPVRPVREVAPGVPARPMTAPRIAVVIGGVQRDRFFPEAMESVLAQTLPRAEYEVVLSRDFPTAEYDRQLLTNGVRTVWDPDRFQGRVARAARMTRAPLVAYLDDDDLFEPDRLAHVLRVFDAHPEVSFYRNRVSVIDEAGRPTDPAGWDRLYRDPSLDRTGPLLVHPEHKRARWLDLLSAYPEFNLSSMVFRREVIESHASLLEGMGARIDLAHFVAAYLGPGAMYLDDRRLTCYRTHRTNNSRIRVQPGQRTPKGWYELRRLERLASDGRQPQVQRWIRDQRIVAGLGFHVDRLTRAVADRAPSSAITAYAREYGQFLLAYPRAMGHVWAWRPAVYSAVQIAVPQLTRAPGVDHALRRDILDNYPRGSWSELTPSSVPGH